MLQMLSVFGAVVIGVVIVTGCAKSGGASTPSAVSSAPVTTGPVAGDATRGMRLFVANCSSCHGATGNEGGIGPSLTDEKTRKNDDQMPGL